MHCRWEGPDYEVTAAPSPKYPARQSIWRATKDTGRILRLSDDDSLVVRPLHGLATQWPHRRSNDPQTAPQAGFDTIPRRVVC